MFSFAFCNAGLADAVEERRLSVIDVPHHCDHRSSRRRSFFSRLDDLFFFLVADHLFERDERCFVAKLLADLFGNFLAQSLIDRSHYAALKQHLNHVLGFDIQLLRKLFDRRAFNKLQEQYAARYASAVREARSKVLSLNIIAPAALHRPLIDANAMIASFQAHNYSLRQPFAEAAAYCQGN